MQVAQQRDHVTHAVITANGNQAESFGISDDPAFFHVLSSTLYRDKLRAVVRETLCNSWDAHIEAGLTEVPVEVHITDKKITFQDFGYGIDKALIRPIYGIYGASTKKSNKNVTGGFGLGCKSPFAYVEHFEVASCHEGEKTIYRMSKSSGAVLGKPSIQPIVTIPTDESGITVSFSILCVADRVRFEKLVRQIAALGEMKVKLNGELLPVMPFSEAKHNYLIVKATDFGEGAEHPVQVRYGNVCYPIEVHESYAATYRDAKNFMKSVRWGIVRDRYGYEVEGKNWVLILQAEPDSISVTPSRESLSMTDHTIETISALLKQFTENVKFPNLEPLCIELNKKVVSNTFLLAKPTDLLHAEKKIACPRALDSLTSDYIVDVKDVPGHYMRNQFPDFRQFAHKDLMMRLNAIVDSQFGKKGLAQTYRAAYIKSRQNKRQRGTQRMYSGTHSDGFGWFMRKLIWPIYKKMANEPLLDKNQLFVWDEGHVGERLIYRDYTTIKPSNYVRNLGGYIQFLRGIVIVAYNRRDIEERAHHHPMMKHWFGSSKKSLCYMVPRKPEKTKAAVEFFQKLGFNVLDLTVRHKWEPEEILVPRVYRDPATPVKKRPQGWPVLSELGPQLSIASLFSETAKRTQTPEFYFQISPKLKRFGNFGNLSAGCSQAIVRLFGSRGAAISTSIQEVKVKATGAVEGTAWVYKQLNDAYKNNPEIKKYYEYSTEHAEQVHNIDLDYEETQILKVMEANDDLLREYKLSKNQWSQDTLDFIAIWNSLGRYSYQVERIKELSEIRDLIKTWGINPEYKILLETIDKSKLVKVIRGTGLAAILNSTGSTISAAQKQAAKDMLLSALKG